MSNQKEYFLQQHTKDGKWTEIVKSYEVNSLLYAGKLRGQRGEICRVLDNTGSIIWQEEGAPISESAQ